MTSEEDRKPEEDCSIHLPRSSLKRHFQKAEVISLLYLQLEQF